MFVSSNFLQAEQVKSGIAYVYDRYLNNCPGAAVVKQAEDFAQQQRMGVRTDPNSEKPWYYHKVNRLCLVGVRDSLVCPLVINLVNVLQGGLLLHLSAFF